MYVLFRQDLAIFDWLNRCVMVVLMYFFINCLSCLFMTTLGNSFVGYSRCDMLMNCGVMMTRLVAITICVRK